jgi:hypothetical protein
MGFLEFDNRVTHVLKTIDRVRHTEEESHKMKW